MLPLPNIEHSLEASREINVQSYDSHTHIIYTSCQYCHRQSCLTILFISTALVILLCIFYSQNQFVINIALMNYCMNTIIFQLFLALMSYFINNRAQFSSVSSSFCWMSCSGFIHWYSLDCNSRLSTSTSIETHMPSYLPCGRPRCSTEATPTMLWVPWQQACGRDN